MTRSTFFSRFKGYNGPEYRGLPNPPFDPAKINPSAFPDELRAKCWEISFVAKTQTVKVVWDSQNWDDNTGALKEEIRRCFSHIGFKGNVILNLAMRGSRGVSAYCHAYIRFRVGTMRKRGQ